MDAVNRENYEAFLLDRLEGRLDAEQEKALEDFLKANPDLQKDALITFDDDLQAQYITDEAFSDKSALLKPVFILPKWAKIAVVIFIVTCTGYFTYTLLNFRPTNTQLIALNKQSENTIAHNNNNEQPLTDTEYRNITAKQPTVSSKIYLKPDKHSFVHTNSSSANIKSTKQQIETYSEETQQVVMIAQTQPQQEENTKPAIKEEEEENKALDMVTYKKSQTIESQNMIAYKQQESDKWKRVKNKITEFINKTKV